MQNEELRKIPSLDKLTNRGGAPKELYKKAARGVLGAVRADVSSGELCPTTAEIERRIDRSLNLTVFKKLQPVINATGIPIHTNLGRVPLSKYTLSEIDRLNRSYCNVELDLESGQRGKRSPYVQDLLNLITGAESSTVVNNCAASVFLTLAALCKNREVIISRGELIQIGGGFRIPDILAASGAILVEVGTTNITRIRDYEHAVTENTAAILKVHHSNFSIQGHTEEASVKEIATLAKEKNILSLMDLGSGLTRQLNISSELTVQDCFRSGLDLVCFSGDKLLGTTQAGFVAGKKHLVDQVAKHPLFRTYRCGRLVLSALQATLEEYLAQKPHPHWKMITETRESLETRTREFNNELGEVGTVEYEDVPVGGGVNPQTVMQSVVLSLLNKNNLHENLRHNQPAIIARCKDNKVLIDLRCVRNEELPELKKALKKYIDGRE